MVPCVGAFAWFTLILRLRSGERLGAGRYAWVRSPISPSSVACGATFPTRGKASFGNSYSFGSALILRFD